MDRGNDPNDRWSFSSQWSIVIPVEYDTETGLSCVCTCGYAVSRIFQGTLQGFQIIDIMESSHSVHQVVSIISRQAIRRSGTQLLLTY
jgi:hypothetical protein